MKGDRRQNKQHTLRELKRRNVMAAVMEAPPCSGLVSMHLQLSEVEMQQK